MEWERWLIGDADTGTGFDKEVRTNYCSSRWPAVVHRVVPASSGDLMNVRDLLRQTLERSPTNHALGIPEPALSRAES
jgi:hypothetical protein